MFGTLINRAKRLVVDEDGTTTVEYSVMIMVIILGCIFGARIIGSLNNEAFQKTAEGIHSGLEQNRQNRE